MKRPNSGRSQPLFVSAIPAVHSPRLRDRLGLLISELDDADWDKPAIRDQTGKRQVSAKADDRC